MFQIISLFVLITPFTSLASDAFPSAYRKENIDYSIYIKRSLRSGSIAEKSLRGSPLSQAKFFKTTELPKATGWKSIPLMQKRFVQTRDARFIEASGRELRRIFWMYPDDECFARAELFVRNSFHTYAPLPNKVFVFGNLRVNTTYSPRGRVGCWYHTAPIVEVKGQKYVLDPSVELSRPLLLEDWLRRKGEPSQIKIAICSSGTYLPADDCKTPSDGTESRVSSAQAYYLSKENKRVRNLNLNASDVLGENPPW